MYIKSSLSSVCSDHEVVSVRTGEIGRCMADICEHWVL
jgi:hypothetical protein